MKTKKEKRKCCRCSNIIYGYGSKNVTTGLCTICQRKESIKVKEDYKVMFPNIKATGTVGAIGEMEVSSYLLKHGFNVFRAISPSSPVDLMVCGKNANYRVEVCVSCNGLNKFPSGKRKQKSNFDILAVVSHQGVKFFNDHEHPIKIDQGSFIDY